MHNEIMFGMKNHQKASELGESECAMQEEMKTNLGLVAQEKNLSAMLLTFHGSRTIVIQK